MSSFNRIRGFVKPYRTYLVLNIVFNLLTVFFSLFSIGLIIPALQIILGKDPVELLSNGSGFGADLQNWFYGILIDFTREKGQNGALLFVSFWVMLAFFLKNLTRYLALYWVAPLRNGVARDLRNAMHDRILALPSPISAKNAKAMWYRV